MFFFYIYPPPLYHKFFVLSSIFFVNYLTNAHLFAAANRRGAPLSNFARRELRGSCSWELWRSCARAAWRSCGLSNFWSCVEAAATFPVVRRPKFDFKNQICSCEQMFYFKNLNFFVKFSARTHRQ